MNYKLIEIKHSQNKEHPENGGLAFLEAEQDIPFPIKRIYWIYGAAKDVRRGFHAHKENVQFLFCPFGRIDVMMDDGTTQETVSLDDPAKGLILSPELWHEMLWMTDGAILCVAASDHYDESDYIRDYDQFLEYAKQLRAGK